MAESWFAVRTRARAEKAVRTHFADRGINAFLPTYTRWSRWKDRKKAVDWPLFGGYCFARFDPAHVLQVLKVPGVATVVSFQGQLAAIPDHEIEAVQLLVATELAYDVVPFIKEGDLVEVTHGPLRGVRGRLVRKDERARLILDVELIAGAVAVDVEVSDVRRV